MSRAPRFHFAWLVFLAACVISFVGFGLTVNTASIYWGPVQESLGVDLSTVSLMSSVSGVAGAVALGVASPLFERFNLKLFLSVMVILTAIAYFVSAGATSIFVLYAANLVLGVTKAVAVMLSIPLLLGNWFHKYLGLVTGIAGAMTAVGGAIFSPMIGAMIADHGWRYAYVFTGIVVLVALLPFTLFVTKLRPTGDQRPFGYVEGGAEKAAETAPVARTIGSAVFRTVPFIGFAAAGVFYQFAGALVQHVPTYLTTTGLTLTVASGIYSLLLIGASVGKFVMGAAIDFFKPMIAIGAFTLIALFGWGGLLLLQGQLALSSAAFASGMAQAINLVAVVVLIRKRFSAQEYSKVLGPVLMVGSLANAAGVYVHGLMVDGAGGYTPSFVLNIALFLGAFVLLAIATGGRRRRDRAEHGAETERDKVEA